MSPAAQPACPAPHTTQAQVYFISFLLLTLQTSSCYAMLGSVAYLTSKDLKTLSYPPMPSTLTPHAFCSYKCMKESTPTTQRCQRHTPENSSYSKTAGGPLRCSVCQVFPATTILQAHPQAATSGLTNQRARTKKAENLIAFCQHLN